MSTGFGERRLAWAYLSRAARGPCAPLVALIEAVGVVEAARAVRECQLPESLRCLTERRGDPVDAQEDLALMERLGGRLITPDDAEWPTWQFLDLARAASEGTHPTGPPLALWARGPLRLVECLDRAVAVVGTRANTPYGEATTTDIAADLATRGWTIVSGAAYGIDGMAHRGCLAVGGNTIAVLACGVDIPYPSGHERLLDRVAQRGVVLSEYPPGTRARKHQFLERNRLIAALAGGVVVVEAGRRSGARNTLKWARLMARPTMAVPGPVHSAASLGCHHMIRHGEAVLVTDAADVLAEAGPLTLATRAEQTPEGAENLTGDQQTVHRALGFEDAREPHDIAEATGLPLERVRVALPALELAGLITVRGAGWCRIGSRSARGQSV